MDLITHAKIHQFLLCLHKNTIFANLFTINNNTHNTSMVHINILTSKDIKNKGKDLKFYYGFCNSPFGRCFIVYSDRGISCLQFTDMLAHTCLHSLQNKLTSATFIENNNTIQLLANKVFSIKNEHNFELFIHGTPFQIQVWHTLLQIPLGKLISYESLAQQAGYPKAVRAVASAVANNPVAYLIPCHRIIRKNGDIGNYRWGKETKKAILKWETELSPDFNNASPEEMER